MTRGQVECQEIDLIFLPGRGSAPAVVVASPALNAVDEDAPRAAGNATVHGPP